MSLTSRIILLLLLVGTLAGQAKTFCSASSDSAAIHFHQSKWNLDKSLGDNAAVLDSIHRKLTLLQGDSIYSIRNVKVIGGASPEGTIKINQFLSEKRAQTLFDHFRQYRKLSDADMTFTFLGRDWEGVLRLAMLDPDLPYRAQTIALLEKIAAEKRETGKKPANSLARLKRLRGGIPYLYLYKHIFPAVRASKIIIDYERQVAPVMVFPEIEPPVLNDIDSVEAWDGGFPASAKPLELGHLSTPFRGQGGLYLDLRTNMLYDAVLLPNIGAEFYLGKNLTLGANWMYGWWSKNARHIYWRAYGGEIFGRWWFGKKAHEKPLTGFHVGVYGQYYMYDFELGGKGEMAGKPEDNLWSQGLFGGGVELGYSLPIAKRLNIDFSLGVGYSGGNYHKYKPIDTHYVWQGTYHRNYFGPTKLEIALVWLLGRNNTNIRHASNVGTRYIASPASTQRKEVPNE